MNQTTVNGSTTLFCDYYKQWITVYKEGAIRPVTMNKYHMAHHWLEKLVPKLTLGDLDRFAYQNIGSSKTIILGLLTGVSLTSSNFSRKYKNAITFFSPVDNSVISLIALVLQSLTL